MIDNDKIKSAARKISEKAVDAKGFDASKPTDLAYLEGHIKGFNAGAKWAINEFLKDLWHPAIKAPDLDKRILYEYKPNGEINPPTHIKEATYEKVRWKECGYKPINPERIITRWLYVDDLLPKEGGKE